MGKVHLTACVLAACGFREGTPLQQQVRDGATTVDGSRDAGASVDAYRAAPTIFAVDPTNLYSLDIPGQQATKIGPLHDSNGPIPNGLDSIAWVDGQLVAIGWTSSPQSIGTIDPTTALVTFEPPLSTTHTYWGLTYDPGRRTVFAATNDTASLYRVNVAAGTTSVIGSFGQGLAIYGDVAWLDGVLYGTMTSGPCDPGCIATIDPTTGTATVLNATAPDALPSLTAFGGALYAISGSGDVYSVDSTTGATSFLFNCGLDLGDAAP